MVEGGNPVVLQPGQKHELTLHITTDDQHTVTIRADLSAANPPAQGSRIDREKFRLFSNAVHTAVYAAPKRGMSSQPAYKLTTNDATGEAVCTVPTADADVAQAITAHLEQQASPTLAVA